MPKDPNVISGEPIESAWGNQTVRDKLVQRATNAADLAASWPAPQDGETVWQQDTNQLWVWDGTQWVEVAVGAGDYVLKVGDTIDAANGTLAAPAYSFDSDKQMGMFRLSSAQIGFAVTGVEVMSMGQDDVYVSSRLRTNDGTATAPGHGFMAEQMGMYRYGAGELGFAANGVNVLRATADRMRIPAIYADTTTNVPNVNVSSDGRLRLSTTTLQSRLDDLEARIAALEA